VLITEMKNPRRSFNSRFTQARGRTTGLKDRTSENVESEE
jgi:hypothetical protein